jgi:dihydrofolate reductase
MGKVIVIEFASVDGVIEDPDGSGGTAWGGWAFRYGPEAVAGDKFLLGDILDTGVMLLGRRSWQLFTKIWPGRTDEFSMKMNAIPKVVASRSLAHAKDWANSELLDGDLVTEVRRLKGERDVVVTGSASVVDALREADLVDQYRLVVFPLVLGEGRRLFGSAGESLSLASVERVGPAVRLVYDRDR